MSARHVAGEVVVDIDEVCNSITGKLKDLEEPKGEPWAIFRVSDEIRKEDPGAYKPQFVSIGPFHRGDPRLLPAERIKRQFLQNLIGRHPSNTLDKYIRAVSTPSFIANVSSCYSEDVVGNDGGNSFVETMVLDGCFVIEFLLKYFSSDRSGVMKFVGDHSVFTNDLLLIENQIPFCVIQVLFDSSFIPGGQSIIQPFTLKELANRYLSMSGMSDGRKPAPELVHHLLHLQLSSVSPPQPEESQAGPVTCQIMKMIKHIIIQSVCWMLSLLLIFRLPLEENYCWTYLRPISTATELYQAGITFQPKRKPRCILDITFRESDGVMEIPRLLVSPPNLSVLRNLAAFERHLHVGGHEFSTYMLLMNCLIVTSADVELLARSGVLNKTVGGSEEVARFFNSIDKLAGWDLNCLCMAVLFHDASRYSSNKSHRWRARMMHDYFSNPWSAISVFAAILLLLLTMLQTFFAVFAYVRPP